MGSQDCSLKMHLFESFVFFFFFFLILHAIYKDCNDLSLNFISYLIIFVSRFILLLNWRNACDMHSLSECLFQLFSNLTFKAKHVKSH